MYRTAFGDPVPANLDELVEAVSELDFDTRDATATIFDPEPDDRKIFQGYTAELMAQDGTLLATGGWETAEGLIDDLVSAGFARIDIERT